jgi:hypothetical protein
MKCVDIEDAIISRDTLRTARRETEVSLNVGHPTRREENLLRIQRKWNSVSSHGFFALLVFEKRLLRRINGLNECVVTVTGGRRKLRFGKLYK